MFNFEEDDRHAAIEFGRQLKGEIQAMVEQMADAKLARFASLVAEMPKPPEQVHNIHVPAQEKPEVHNHISVPKPRVDNHVTLPEMKPSFSIPVPAVHFQGAPKDWYATVLEAIRDLTAELKRKNSAMLVYDYDEKGRIMACRQVFP